MDIDASNFAEYGFEEKLRDLGKEIGRLESDRDAVTSELDRLQKHAETRASLNAAKDNLAKVVTRIEEAYVKSPCPHNAAYR